MKRHTYKMLFTLSSFLLLTGCASRVATSVDAIGSDDTLAQKTYYLDSADIHIKSSDLQFKEYAKYIDWAMKQSGYSRTDIFENSNVTVFASYEISDPQVTEYKYSIPIYGQTGVSSSTTYGSLNTIGNTGYYNATTYYTPTYGITGSTTHTGKRVDYIRRITLTGMESSTVGSSKGANVLWKISGTSIGKSGDLREIFPYMIISMSPYIGKNTGKSVEVIVQSDDKRLHDLGVNPSK